MNYDRITHQWFVHRKNDFPNPRLVRKGKGRESPPASKFIPRYAHAHASENVHTRIAPQPQQKYVCSGALHSLSADCALRNVPSWSSDFVGFCIAFYQKSKLVFQRSECQKRCLQPSPTLGHGQRSEQLVVSWWVSSSARNPTMHMCTKEVTDSSR